LAPAVPSVPMLVAGTVSGPDTADLPRTQVFAVINDAEDHPTASTSSQPALGPSAWVQLDGTFVLPVSVTTAVTNEANLHDGHVNLLLVALNADGSLGEYGLPLKLTGSGQLVDGRLESNPPPIAIGLLPPTATSSQAASPVASALQSSVPVLLLTNETSSSPCVVYSALIASSNADTVVAELHTWDHMSATWIYHHTATSEIDLGYSQDGSSNWKFGGSTTFNTEKGNTTGQNASGDFGWQMRTTGTYN